MRRRRHLGANGRAILIFGLRAVQDCVARGAHAAFYGLTALALRPYGTSYLSAAAFQIAYDPSAVLYGLDCSRRSAPLLPVVYLLLILPRLSFGTTAGLGSVLSQPDISGWLLGRHKALRFAVKQLRRSILAVLCAFTHCILPA